MQLLAYRDPTGRVFILNESQALPPLAEGYEWTMVIQPDSIHREPPQGYAQPEPEPAPRNAARPASGGILDMVIPMLTPRPGQSAQERAQEIVEALPADLRSKLGQLVRAFHRPELPPFPGS